MKHKLEKCRCGEPAQTYKSSFAEKYTVIHLACPAAVPWFDTPAEANAAWNRMQSPETFTRDEVRELMRLAQLSDDTFDALIDAIKHHRRKP